MISIYYGSLNNGIQYWRIFNILKPVLHEKYLEGTLNVSFKTGLINVQQDCNDLYQILLEFSFAKVRKFNFYKSTRWAAFFC